MRLLVIGDTTVNDCRFACVDNNKWQAYDRARIWYPIITLHSTIPLYQVLECNLLHRQHAHNGNK